MSRAIYIGRFQVFHRGHLDVLQFIDAAVDVDELSVVLGSTQYDHTNRSPVTTWAMNPFTAAERTEMIASSVAGQLRKPFRIVPVPDFHDWPRWHACVVETAGPFRFLYTADREEAVFFSARGTEVRRFPKIRDFHAGAVRQWLADDAPWRHAVPDGAADVLERIGAGPRMRELLARDAAAAAHA